MKIRVTAVATAVLLLLVAASFAARPVRNVSYARHSNLASAQHFCREAFEKIAAAQRANEWDMNGHAQKTKELLDQVTFELKLAAEAAIANNPR